MILHGSRLKFAWSSAAGAAVLALGCLSLLAQSRQPAARGSARPAAAAAAPGRPIKVLFVGTSEETPHNPSKMFPLLAAPLARRGIQLTYGRSPAEALDARKLSYYDAVMIYGDQLALTAAQQTLLTSFVGDGHGVVALHGVGELPLVGARLQPQGGAEFTAEIVQPANPVVQGIEPFRTWEEPLASAPAGTGRTVVMERVDAQGRQPWTWLKTQGKGRVFYTAYGHDERTWSNPGFQNLVERGIVWSVDEARRRTWQQLEMPGITYVDGFNVPNYENRPDPPKFQLPFPPDQAEKFMQTPAEFRVELFASEPDIIKPITFTFDERGRLWVVEAMDYPNEVLNGNPGDDRIKILEDTNGDGRADKFTVFAEHLNLPTSLTFANGGVIVAAAPHFLFLKDTNGDDKADVRQILNTGWGIRDSHAGPSNLQYGPDNHIWGVVGYSGYNGQMNGKPLQFTQGAYRFKPDGSDFEYLTQSTNNTWGLGFSETFDVFGSTANNDQSWYMAIPNRYFEDVQGLPGTGGQGGRGIPSGAGYQSSSAFYSVHPTTPYIRQVDVWGGYTAAAGHYLYTARAYPKEYWNRVALVSEPTAHLIGQIVLDKQGAGFVARDGWNLISSAEEWFAPVAAMVGPDGAVWFADWYNFIAQHNPTPPGFSAGKGAAYETSMRDHIRGRIYRIVYRGAPATKKRSLSKNDPAGLISALGADNMFWRLHAQRLIVERGQKDVVPQLIALARNQSVDEIGTNGGALHALWTLQGLGELNATTTEAYRAAVGDLKHPAAGVRKAAAMVVPHVADAAQAILSAGLLRDPDLHTRLAATLAIADMPTSPEIGQALYSESLKPDNYSDKWLSRAFYIAGSRHRKSFTAAYHADRSALPYTALPISVRIGAVKPDWRMPAAQEVSTDWSDMEVPGNWEAHGLPDFDGVVWFTRTFEAAAADGAATLSLGPLRNVGEVWVNGQSVTPAPFVPPAAPPAAAPGARGAAPAPAGGGRGNASATYVLPQGVLHAGTNTVTVRIQNQRNEGGFLGTPDVVYLQSGANRTPLAGTWKYRVERQTNAGALYTKPGQLAAHVAFTAEGGPTGTSLPPVAPQAPDVVLRLSVVPNQMKFDQTELNVAPGQLVEITYVNPDVMQHNFVLGAPGSLTAIGEAGDKLATSPTALAQAYVPDMPQVLYSTKLLEPGQTVTFQFRAPSNAGQYPYVCTFPAHWRTMNGVLNVVAPAGRGGRGRGGQ
jgi:putative membrane-bound dehydrogenase-like protein